MSTPQPQLAIVTALACEAKPLVDFYHLKRKHNESAFEIYANTANSIHLIVSGVGIIKSAAACAYLYAITGCKAYTCFLNLGIAGSGEHEVGELLLVNKITDALTERSLYPYISRQYQLPQAAILTCHQPQSEYPKQVMIDMEAYAFFNTATQFVTKEQVQVVKIISDNSQLTLQKIDKQTVINLIEQRLTETDSLVKQLLTLSCQEMELLQPLDDLERMYSTWHFSHYQQNQLDELLRRWQINLSSENPVEYCHTAKTAKEVIALLTKGLAQANYSW